MEEKSAFTIMHSRSPKRRLFNYAPANSFGGLGHFCRVYGVLLNCEPEHTPSPSVRRRHRDRISISHNQCYFCLWSSSFFSCLRNPKGSRPEPRTSNDPRPAAYFILISETTVTGFEPSAHLSRFFEALVAIQCCRK